MIYTHTLNWRVLLASILTLFAFIWIASMDTAKSPEDQTPSKAVMQGEKLPPHGDKEITLLDYLSEGGLWVFTLALAYFAMVDLAIYISGATTPYVSWHVQELFRIRPYTAWVFAALAYHWLCRGPMK